MDQDLRLATSSDLPAVLDLIRDEFAYMDERIDPPSSIHGMTLKGFDNKEVWVLGNPICACMVLSVNADAMYLGKVAIRSHKRGNGLLRRLIDQAGDRALKFGKDRLQLESRIELSDVHHAFRSVGFEEVRRGAHEGFETDTFIVMEKDIR